MWSLTQPTSIYTHTSTLRYWLAHLVLSREFSKPFDRGGAGDTIPASLPLFCLVPKPSVSTSLEPPAYRLLHVATSLARASADGFPTPTFRSIATCRPPCACRSTMSSAAATEALPSLTTAPTLGELATAPAATTLSRPWPRSAGNANSESRTRTRARTNGIHSRSEQKARARRDGVGFATSWQRRGSVDIRGRSVAAVLLSADGCKR